MSLHVEIIGSGPRLVLVHGTMGYPAGWKEQRPLAERYQLELITRPGYPPNPQEGRLDFERDANLLAEYLTGKAHLFGHSYGGIICLLAAAIHPEAVQSITVAEPAGFRVARGNPHVEDFVSMYTNLYESWSDDPLGFATAFLGMGGVSPRFPDPLPSHVLQSIRAAMAERYPWEADIPLACLQKAAFPKFIISGADTHPSLIAVCDVLEQELGAERAILPGTGHLNMDYPDFNRVLDDFLSRH